MWLRLAWKLLCSPGWPWTPDLPASASHLLRLGIHYHAPPNSGLFKRLKLLCFCLWLDRMCNSWFGIFMFDRILNKRPIIITWASLQTQPVWHLVCCLFPPPRKPDRILYHTGSGWLLALSSLPCFSISKNALLFGYSDFAANRLYSNQFKHAEVQFV